MKVLVCIPCLLTGGTEIQTLSLVAALVGAGHEVVVACYFEHSEEMVARFKGARCEVRLLSLDGVRPIGFWQTMSRLYSGLRSAIREFSPDIVHVQYMTPGALTILILRALGVKKIVATTHTDANIYSKNGLRMIKLISAYCTKAFQCITLKAEKSYFGTASLFNGTLTKHFTIYNALPSHISILSVPRDYSNKTALTVGVVSRLADIKGMDMVVPAFARAMQLSADIAPLRLLIVGDGALRELMERQATVLNYAEGVIEFVGRKEQNELQEWYDRIDILLMPSRSEGFGLTAIEGMARGCVPIVADTGGLSEVVRADCGLLHKSEDIIDLAEKIHCLAIDRTLLARISQGSLKRAADFSAAHYQEQIASLYALL